MGPLLKGSLLHTWGPSGYVPIRQIALWNWYAVSIMLGPDNEIRFARLQRSEDTLLGLAQVLRGVCENLLGISRRWTSI